MIIAAYVLIGIAVLGTIAILLCIRATIKAEIRMVNEECDRHEIEKYGRILP